VVDRIKAKVKEIKEARKLVSMGGNGRNENGVFA